MAYTKSELLNLGAKDINDARKKIVGINLFDNIDDLVLSDNVLNSLSYTLELYKEYLEMLKSLNKTTLDKLLREFQKKDILNNHILENEELVKLQAYQETHHWSSVNYLIKRLITDGVLLNDLIMKKAHEILMRGTSNDANILSDFRINNNHYVGYNENGKRIILFYPISYDEITQAINLFFSYYNAKSSNEIDLLIKPIISHGLLASLQAFEDGNTRLARILQHVNLFTNTINLLDKDFSLPTIYFSKAYSPYYVEYRDLIANLAINPNNENWNNWLKFNIYRLQDQIYLNQENLCKIKKR